MSINHSLPFSNRSFIDLTKEWRHVRHVWLGIHPAPQLIIECALELELAARCERCHVDSAMFAREARTVRPTNQITPPPLQVQLGRFPHCIKESPPLHYWSMHSWECVLFVLAAAVRAVWILHSQKHSRAAANSNLQRAAVLICSARSSLRLFCYLGGAEAKPSVIKFPERKRNEICLRQHQDEADLVPNCKAFACLIYEGWNQRLVWGIAPCELAARVCFPHLPRKFNGANYNYNETWMHRETSHLRLLKFK